MWRGVVTVIAWLSLLGNVSFSEKLSKFKITKPDSTCNVSTALKEEIVGYAPKIRQIMDSVVHGDMKGSTWDSLAEMVDKFGPRLSGSKTLEDAIDYMLNESQMNGLQNVHDEKVLVPHWVRGNESAVLVEPRVINLPMLGLGGSVGTPPGGIVAEAIIVKSFDELRSQTQDAKGKIIVFAQNYEGYFETLSFRLQAAVEGARLGGAATLIRSVTPFSMASPHTGWQFYNENVTKIPTACITVEDADMLYRMHRRGDRLVIHLKMEARTLDPTWSRNLIAELQGRSLPYKAVVVSGHLDSWDVGQGAMDDGGGSIISWNTLVLLKKLNFIPRRTIRLILWTAEEVGMVGAEAYVKRHMDEIDNLDFVMESDGGTFRPLGINFSGSKEAGCILQEILKLLEPINATKFDTPQDGGPDIQMWVDLGVPGASLINDRGELYYWFHHSKADTMAVMDPNILDLCTAVWASISYVVADLSVDIPRKQNPLLGN